MKNNFKYYAGVWAVLLAVYNVVTFSVKALPGYVIEYDSRFWISWGLIIAAFIGQLACAFVAFKADNNEKLFMNIPLITESYGATVLMTIAGSVCMLIPDCPQWIATVVCVIILAFGVISVISARAAADIVNEVHETVKNNTLFIKSLTLDAENLMAAATDAEIKAELKKVYEAVRYSDPMSSEALAGIESQITIGFAKLEEIVKLGNVEEVSEAARELVILVNDRNKKCRLLK